MNYNFKQIFLNDSNIEYNKVDFQFEDRFNQIKILRCLLTRPSFTRIRLFYKMLLPLLLLTASAQHDHEKHLSTEQIAKEIDAIQNLEPGKIVEYIRNHARTIGELEKAEAKAKKTTKEELDKWHADNIQEYYDAVDKVIIGNQVCYSKYPTYEDCRVAEIFQGHGNLGSRGDTYREDFMKEIRNSMRKLKRGDL